jgi:hypothetical protein
MGRSDAELLALAQHLKLTVDFDSSISQSSGKTPKYSGLSFVRVLTKGGVHAKSSKEALTILDELEAGGLLHKSSGSATFKGASPLKDKVHYRFNDQLITENSRRSSRGLIASLPSMHESPFSAKEEPTLTQTTTKTNENDGRDRETMARRFASSFVAMYLFHFLSVHYPDMSGIRRLLLITFLTAFSIAVTNRKMVSSETTTVTVPLSAAADVNMGGGRMSLSKPLVEKTSTSATSLV